MASAMPLPTTTTMATAAAADDNAQRRPRLLQEFVVIDLPPDHPSRLQVEVAVPPGVEDDEEKAEAAKLKDKQGPTSSGGLATGLASPGGFLDQNPPARSLRLPDAAIERASAPLRPGDQAGAQVLREVFGGKLPWTERELFCSGK